MRSLSLLVLTALALTQGDIASAETLRCGGSLVQPGMTAEQVLEKCGAPASKETIRQPVMARRPSGATQRVGTTTYEIWRYDRGSRQFPAVLTFSEKGVLTKLEFET